MNAAVIRPVYDRAEGVGTDRRSWAWTPGRGWCFWNNVNNEWMRSIPPPFYEAVWHQSPQSKRLYGEQPEKNKPADPVEA